MPGGIEPRMKTPPARSTRPLGDKPYGVVNQNRAAMSTHRILVVAHIAMLLTRAIRQYPEKQERIGDPEASKLLSRP
jgi:hypothetical protein